MATVPVAIPVVLTPGGGGAEDIGQPAFTLLVLVVAAPPLALGLVAATLRSNVARGD